MYSITLKSILNDVQPIKGFVYESVIYSTAVVDTIEVVVVPRQGSQPRCSGCGRAGPTYDHAAQAAGLDPAAFVQICDGFDLHDAPGQMPQLRRAGREGSLGHGQVQLVPRLSTPAGPLGAQTFVG